MLQGYNLILTSVMQLRGKVDYVGISITVEN